jgi:adenylyltransferase/sulfurtransferase
VAAAGAGRYARQAAAFGPEGHDRIRRARILVVGMGGLGCPAAQYLAGAGVATLGLCDPDRVAASDLPRQTLYAAADVGQPKVLAAARRLGELNPDVRIVLHPTAFGSDAAGAATVAGYDIALGCTDSDAARYALADACAAAGIPLVHGAVSGWEGLCTVLDPPRAPCYRCLWPAPGAAGPTCAEEGVAGPVPGLVGTLQAQEALKLAAGVGQSLAGRLLLLDGLSATSRSITLMRRPGCRCHVDESPQACPLPWNRPTAPDISVQDFAARRGDYLLVDVREPDEFEEDRIPGSRLIPLGDLPSRLAELPRGKTIVFHCGSGGRSARATVLARERGLDALNLRGGIRAWQLLQP